MEYQSRLPVKNINILCFIIEKPFLLLGTRLRLLII